MYAIWKYTVSIDEIDKDGFATVEMPHQTKVLSVGNQRGDVERYSNHDSPFVTIWAAVKTDATPRLRKIRLVLTGRQLKKPVEPERFVGTVMFDGGDFVVHVFDYGEVS